MVDIKLTKNFRLSEVVCKCGCCKNREDIPVHPGAMMKLQKMRDIFGDSMVITSAYRCESHNKKVGGAKDSWHLHGKAFDISCNVSSDRRALVEAAMVAGFGGIGITKLFIHVDDRPVNETPVLFLY